MNYLLLLIILLILQNIQIYIYFLLKIARGKENSIRIKNIPHTHHILSVNIYI